MYFQLGKLHFFPSLKVINDSKMFTTYISAFFLLLCPIHKPDHHLVSALPLFTYLFFFLSLKKYPGCIFVSAFQILHTNLNALNAKYC